MMSGLDCYAKQGGNESCLGQRVALTDPPSRPRELHPEPLTDSVLEPLDSHGSCHPLKAAAFHQNHRAPPVAR